MDRTLPTLTLLALLPMLASAHALPGLLDGRGVDGVTAEIRSVGPLGNDLLFTRADNGTIPVEIRVHRDGADGWKQVRMHATLRVFSHHPDLTASDRVSIPFRSSAADSTLVWIPAGALATGEVVDVFVTFSELGGQPVPTSHHSPQKNALIAQGEFSEAERFDYHRLLAALVG